VLAALRALRPSVGVRAVSVSAQLSAAEEHAQRRLLRLLDLPARAFERSGARTLVAFDEFEDMLGAESNADGVIRSRIQHHREEAAYVFAGSLPGMMRTLFESRGRAFFGQTSALTLGPLPEAELADFLQRRFEATGKQLGELLDPPLDLAAGPPHAAMMLAHHLWEHTPAGGRADIDGWEAARAAVFAEVHDRYVATWEGLHDSERKLMSALASEPQPFAREALVRRGLKPATARKARGRLLADGELVRDEHGWRLADHSSPPGSPKQGAATRSPDRRTSRAGGRLGRSRVPGQVADRFGDVALVPVGQKEASGSLPCEAKPPSEAP
jgi:hypothetical protein